MRHFLAGCVIFLLSSGAISAQQLMDFDALYGFDQVTDIQLSPTGLRLAYTLTHNDLEKHSRSTTIQVLDLQRGEVIRLSNGSEGASAPRWLPDGRRLAYSARGSTGSQFWIADPDSGQSRQITHLSGGAGSLVWFPDGRRFLFSSSVYPDCPDDECNRLRDSVAEENPMQAKLYDHLLFRHYDSWDSGKQNRLFLGATDTDTAVDVTPGAYDVPPIAGGGNPAYAISPDGSEICYAMSTDPVPAVSCDNDLYIVPVAGGEPMSITDNQGNDGNPVYSPDGKYIAYYEMVRPGYESEQRDIILYNRADRTRKNLTAEFDRSVFEMVFSPDSKHLYFAAPDLGFINVYHVAVKGSEVEEIVGDATHGDLAISPDGKALYFTRSTSTQPGEIFSYHLREKKLTRLTFHTQDLTDRIAMRPSEEFWFYSVDSLPIQGYLTHPPDFDPAKKYPLALLIHGGPQWCWLNDFNFYGWNIHLLAAQGYVVAQINPRGSRGYGREFCDAVSGDWGGKDYQDLMIGVDYLASRFTYIDTARMAALGRSYGGFMANWICGHTDRFKCLISIDGTFEQVSDYYSTEELWFPEWEFKGTPWTNRELYLDRSPERFVANFKTPTLVIHGQYDYRVDLSQGLMMFTALQRRGVPSQLLYFPDEGHSVNKLRNLRHVYEVQLAWLAKYLKE